MGSFLSLTHHQEGALRRKCREGSYLNDTQRLPIGCLESTVGRKDKLVRPRMSASTGASSPGGTATKVIGQAKVKKALKSLNRPCLVFRGPSKRD